MKRHHPPQRWRMRRQLCSALGTPSLGRRCRPGTSRGYPIFSAAYLAGPALPTRHRSGRYRAPTPAPQAATMPDAEFASLLLAGNN
jgi:hypothetical protein